MFFKKIVAVSSVLFSSAVMASQGLPSLARPLPNLDYETLDMRYQVGSEWGKNVVKLSDFDKIASLEKIAKGTIKLGGGTAFYLGKFAGHHVIATNHHVCPGKWQCRFQKAKFPLLNKSYPVEHFIGTWSDIDAALMTIKVDQSDDSLLSQYANPFAFDVSLYRGQELMTVGFGTANNRNRVMVANYDDDCRVFSGEDEFRFMPDPDALNTGSYYAWSFANGCDISHGDSGSAMVDRTTGEVVGIIWTGKIPKSDRVQNSDFLKTLLDQPTEDVWSELSYAVPAAKIGEFLGNLTTERKVDGLSLDIINEMLNR